MTEGFLEILRRYGQPVTLLRGGTQSTLLALLSLEKQAPATVGPLGELDERRWRMFSREEVGRGDEILSQGQRFELLSAEKVSAGRELSHYRAELRRARL